MTSSHASRRERDWDRDAIDAARLGLTTRVIETATRAIDLDGSAKKATDDTNFFFRHDYLDEARSFGKGLVGWYMVRVRDPTSGRTM